MPTNNDHSEHFLQGMSEINAHLACGSRKPEPCFANKQNGRGGVATFASGLNLFERSEFDIGSALVVATAEQKVVTDSHPQNYA